MKNKNHKKRQELREGRTGKRSEKKKIQEKEVDKLEDSRRASK